MQAIISRTGIVLRSLDFSSIQICVCARWYSTQNGQAQRTMPVDFEAMPLPSNMYEFDRPPPGALKESQGSCLGEAPEIQLTTSKDLARNAQIAQTASDAVRSVMQDTFSDILKNIPTHSSQVNFNSSPSHASYLNPQNDENSFEFFPDQLDLNYNNPPSGYFKKQNTENLHSFLNRNDYVPIRNDSVPIHKYEYDKFQPQKIRSIPNGVNGLMGQAQSASSLLEKPQKILDVSEFRRVFNQRSDFIKHHPVPVSRLNGDRNRKSNLNLNNNLKSNFEPNYQRNIRVSRKEERLRIKKERKTKRKRLFNVHPVRPSRNLQLNNISHSSEKVSKRKEARKLRKDEKVIELPVSITIRELSQLFKIKIDALVSKLKSFKYKRLKRPTSIIKQSISEFLASEFDIPYSLQKREVEDVYPISELSNEAKERPPLVCVMGHVNHGKTTLIDTVRKTHVADHEAGGITQSIGAFSVTLSNPGKLTLFDTPGHAAFSSMRARGVGMVDTVILVLAADEGVMPQTIESAKMAQKAGVPIVIAITKCDVSNANPEKVRRELSQHGLFSVELGGDISVKEISSKTNEGVQDLLDEVHLVGRCEEPKAEPNVFAEAVVIESRIDERDGIVANVLVRHGTLRVGQYFVSGDFCWGKIKRLRDQNNREVKFADPSMPVSILGLNSLADIGSDILVVDDEKKARQVHQYRTEKAARKKLKEQIFWHQEDKFVLKPKVKELTAILKGDVSGSVEAATEFFNSVYAPDNEVTVKLAHSGVGEINSGDVKLAHSLQAKIFGFGVDISDAARNDANSLNVDIRTHKVIFHMMDDVLEMMTENLDDKFESKVVGTAIISKQYKTIAGCTIKSGTFYKQPGYGVRVRRNGVIIFEQTTKPVTSLRRNKDSVKEVKAGLDCGIDLGLFISHEIGDFIECIKQIKIERCVEMPVSSTEQYTSLEESFGQTTTVNEQMIDNTSTNSKSDNHKSFHYPFAFNDISSRSSTQTAAFAS